MTPTHPAATPDRALTEERIDGGGRNTDERFRDRIASARDNNHDWMIASCDDVERLYRRLSAADTERAALHARVVALEGALREITTMGHVCPDFETCDHVACHDSCGACLIALEALRPTSAAPAAEKGDDDV